MKQFHIILLTIIAITFFKVSILTIYAEDKSQPKQKTITINTLGRLDIGTIANSKSRIDFLDEKTITFEIKCESQRRIHITKIEFANPKEISFVTEWKAGNNTGFEQPFGNGIFFVDNGSFFVTVKLKSIDLSRIIESRKYNLNISIYVEYLDY